MKALSVSTLLLLSILAAVPASAGPVVFDNYPVNGTIDAWTINYGFWVSDSFTLASTSTVTGVNFGVWLPYSR